MFSVENQNVSLYRIVSFGILFFCWLLFYGINTSLGKNYYNIDSGWDVSINNVNYKRVKLSEFELGILNRGDVVDFSITVPKEMENKRCIQPVTYTSAFEAFLDDECIYSYYMDEYRQNKFIPSTIHFIELPEDCYGKELRLRLYQNERGSMSCFDPVRCTEAKEGKILLFRRGLLNFAIGVFLIGVGIAWTLIALVLVIKDKMFLPLAMIGLFSVFVGCWICCNNFMTHLITGNDMFSTQLEYSALYLCSIPFGIIVICVHRFMGGKRSWILEILVGIFAVIITVFFILHFTNTVRFPGVLWLYHILGIIYISAVLAFAFGRVEKKSTAYNLFISGMIILAMSLFMDIVRYNIKKYILATDLMFANSFIPSGVLLVIIFLFVSFLTHIYEVSLTKSDRVYLTDLAFKDTLTGLYNRTCYEDDFDLLNKTNRNVALINFDVNGLKYVNDKYGHKYGDDLLLSFARILDTSFGEIGKVYRMSGDEFLAVIDENNISKIDTHLEICTALCSSHSKTKKFNISASYGVAYRNDAPSGDLQKVYSLADQRMYKMKMESAASRRGRR